MPADSAMRRSLVLLFPLLLGYGAARVAAEGAEASPERLAAEGWLGGSGHLMEIADLVRDGLAAESPASAMDALASLAREARSSGRHAVCMEAEIGWLQLAVDHGEADATDAIEELAERARDWRLPREEARLWQWRAELFEAAGDWLAAFHALDRAAQAALGGGLLNRGAAALVGMARLCREHGHPWRLQHQWVRIDALLGTRVADLDSDARAALDAERAAGTALLAGLPPLEAPATEAARINPVVASSMVSRPQREIGRTRFQLTNPTPQSVEGRLTVSPRRGAAGTWQTGADGSTLRLQPPAAGSAEEPVSASRTLTLRPGESAAFYLEHLPAADENSAALRWEEVSGARTATAAAEFRFVDSVPDASIVTGGAFAPLPGWPLPFHHEINQRTGGVRVEPLGFLASVPCRLEYFDGDASPAAGIPSTRLLAVDEQGDGVFDGPGDRVLSDHDGDGQPDILVGDRSRTLEVYAWPLLPLRGESVTLSARLRRRTDAAAGWRTDVENELAPDGRAVSSGD